MELFSIIAKEALIVVHCIYTYIYMMTKESKTFESALLTKSEPERLLGETHISRPYEDST